MRALLGFAIAAGAFVACGGSQPAPATTPPPTYDPYAAYYPQQDPNAPPGAYPSAPPGAYPTAPPTAAPTAPPPPATTLSTPGPLALPCQQDSACILARCNTQYQKCVFPCQNAGDCAQGASCNAPTGLCLPGG